ncbi:hypothetical protein SCB71_15485 [Herbiconiux sp. KACC 21604]|uniref:hypothetical protein n=1 Tax=unclassified Herbiconiux TaxID=2618217 RepID=UPI001492E99A|nr:hypothetical protein [Herbiconiux sp. SALV-R1]QJU54529.1 hypothetical protein HL652_13430 [Herbiconiux sp. SALV-R1]WPO85612.1 hypothetical protein SCB71_15485 [Herbiconiux sp. KACC 21604]
MAGTSPSAKAFTQQFRDLVARVLSAASGRVVRTTDPYRVNGGTHVLGLPNWTLIIRNHNAVNVPKLIDEAKEAAEGEGSENYAVVMHRKGSENVGASYVLLDLAVFSNLIRDRAQHEQ